MNYQILHFSFFGFIGEPIGQDHAFANSGESDRTPRTRTTFGL